MSAGPVLDVDLASGQVDHLLVVANTRARTLATSQLVARRRPVCSAEAFREPARKSLASQVMLAFPQLPWGHAS